MKEKILCAAIRYDDGRTRLNHEEYGTGFVVGGYDHATIKSIGISNPNQTEGFITSKNRFVDREEAAKIAFECGQTKKKEETLYSFHLY